MAMSHKAYVLDYDGFRRELAPILHDALRTRSVVELTQFVEAHRPQLTWPWEPSALPEAWRGQLETVDVQSLGDLALTKYYDSGADWGIAESWVVVEASIASEDRAALLGEPFGVDGNQFDPGAMGSYFQSPDSVADAERRLAGYRRPELQRFLRGLQLAEGQSHGIYVTF